MTSHRPRRLPVRLSLRTGVAAALASGLLLAGCSATNPIETSKPYDPSDGIGATLGDVRASNLMIVSEGVGKPGVLLGAFTNDGDEDVTLTIAFGGVDAAEGAEPSADPASIDLPAGETVLLSNAVDGGDLQVVNERVAVTATPAAPGDLAAIAVSSDVSGGTTLRVPVLDGTLPDYASVLPTPEA
ncbi:hypothetical protein [Cellulomonas persica]|uniref:Lipoprotein n=1 Tax=Cellulomonas persica TaxID=76861 RepID=A0A510UVE8_9CELL|nr:hypothetical protein [Cellulomonas persica]GEK18519.1 hypothetical protein CPE01_22520 [Cellulomonas persica]